VNATIQNTDRSVKQDSSDRDGLGTREWTWKIIPCLGKNMGQGLRNLAFR